MYPKSTQLARTSITQLLRLAFSNNKSQFHVSVFFQQTQESLYNNEKYIVIL